MDNALDPTEGCTFGTTDTLNTGVNLSEDDSSSDEDFYEAAGEDRYRLRAAGVELFFSTFSKAINMLNLRRFEIIRSVVPYDADDTQAHAWVLFGGPAASVAKLVLCEEWHQLKPTKDAIESVALHEALHVLFHPMLQEAGGWAGKSDAVRRLEHEVINILVWELAGNLD